MPHFLKRKRMIKYYCDFCKKELSEEECYFIRIPIPTDTVIKTYYMIPLQEYLTKGMKIESRHICFSCTHFLPIFSCYLRDRGSCG